MPYHGGIVSQTIKQKENKLTKKKERKKESNLLSPVKVITFEVSTWRDCFRILGVERNQNQDFLQGQEFLHIYLSRYMYREFRCRYRNSWQGKVVNTFISMKKCKVLTFTFSMKCTGKNKSLLFLHRNKCVHCFSLPGIPVPASEFPVHVPAQINMQEFLSLQKILVLVPLNPYRIQET